MKARHTRPILGGEVTCPTCNAQPGKPCVSSTGNPVGGFSHSARTSLQRSLTCRHCGHPINDDASSATGYRHIGAYTRCDGRSARAAGSVLATRAQP